VDILDSFVAPSSTDTWRSPSTRLSSPLATHQLTAGEFISVCAMVDLL
jgi:hypothetical protein